MIRLVLLSIFLVLTPVRASVAFPYTCGQVEWGQAHLSKAFIEAQKAKMTKAEIREAKAFIKACRRKK